MPHGTLTQTTPFTPPPPLQQATAAPEVVWRRRTRGVRAAALAVAVATCCVGGDAVVGAGNQTATPARGGAAAARPPAPGLVFAFELRATVAAPTELGQVAAGRRRIVEITGGTFEGPTLKGRVRPGGADWQIVRADGFTELDTRYTIETDKGELVYVRNGGMRHAPPDVMTRLLAGQPVDPSLVYFRTVPTFETSAPALQWMTRAVFVGTGERYPNEVVIRFWRVE